MLRRIPRRGQGGFTIVETLIVILLIGIATAVFSPFMFGVFRRERMRSVVREVYSIVLAARMQAVKRNTRVVVFFDLPKHRVISWAENAPFNFTQDVGEPTLTEFELPKQIDFQYHGGAIDDADAVSFDKYIANAALVDMIVYQGDGTLLAPSATNSGLPLRPGSVTTAVPSGSANVKTGGGHARGVYISDPEGNTFRISVDDFGSSGRASLLKFLPTSQGGLGGEIDYVPAPWQWTQ